jgi:hypothetical protein
VSPLYIALQIYWYNVSEFVSRMHGPKFFMSEVVVLCLHEPVIFGIMLGELAVHYVEHRYLGGLNHQLDAAECKSSCVRVHFLEPIFSSI